MLRFKPNTSLATSLTIALMAIAFDACLSNLLAAQVPKTVGHKPAAANLVIESDSISSLFGLKTYNIPMLFGSRNYPISRESRELRDLVAQENMASSAFLGVIAAGLTVLVTSVGTLLIYRQVKLTQKAVRDSAKASEAMLAANDLMKENFELQNRPFLLPENVKWSLRTNDLKEYLDISVIWKNYGNTPSLNCTFDAWITDIDHIDDLTDSHGNDSMMTSIGPQGSVSGPVISLTLDEVHEVWMQKKNLIIKGNCRYKDILSEKSRETRHAWRIHILRRDGIPLEGNNILSVDWWAVGDDNYMT